MIADVTGYNAQMDSLQDYHNGVQLNLTNLQAFTGRVVVDMSALISITTEQLRTEYQEFEDHVNIQNAAALSSYTDIDDMTEAIRIYNTNVSVFASRVEAGMAIINVARELR